MITAILYRAEDNGTQTLSFINFYNGLKHLFSCVGLEPSFVDNIKNISSIKADTYRVVPRYSTKYGWHWEVLDVEGRSLILFHWGNFRKDTRGCILVGKTFYDLDKDGNKDVTSSKATMKQMRRVIGRKEFLLKIA